jgi:hypothetical protein
LEGIIDENHLKIQGKFEKFELFHQIFKQ